MAGWWRIGEPDRPDRPAIDRTGPGRTGHRPRGGVVGRTVERNHHRGIAYIEIHVAGRNDLAVPLDRTGRRDGDHFQLGIEQCLGRVGVDLRIGIVGGRLGDCNAVRGDETGEVVDMAVGMVVEQAFAQPNHTRRAEVPLKPLLNLVPVQAGIAVRIEQALLGGEQGSAAVAVDRPSFEDPVGSGAGD